MILHYKSPAFSDDEKTYLFVNIITEDSSGRIHRKPLFRSSNATTWNRYDIILQSSVEFQVNFLEFSLILKDAITFRLLAQISLWTFCHWVGFSCRKYPTKMRSVVQNEWGSLLFLTCSCQHDLQLLEVFVVDTRHLE